MLDNQDEQKKLEESILELVEDYSQIRHKTPEFIPGISRVPVNGRVLIPLKSNH